MPNPRQRRLMRRQIGAKVLEPAGLTNVEAGDRTSTSALSNLQNLALYSAGGISPVFANGDADLLSDASSNGDSLYTGVGLTGETTDATALGLTALSKHYFFPSAISNSQTVLSGTSNDPLKTSVGSVIVYTYDQTKAKYVPYYLGGTATTGSIRFGTGLTGSETNVQFVFFGTGSSGDSIQVRKLSDNSLFTKVGGGNAEITSLENGVYTSFKIAKTSIATETGYLLAYSSSAKTSTTQAVGIACVISASS